jgi:hypothetical protein
MITVEAIEDRGGFKYRIPGVQGFVTPSRKTASMLSSTPVIVREVKAVAFAVGVRLPSRWELMVKR